MSLLIEPWSDETMSQRCLACHSQVRDQIATRQSLHGRLADAQNCLRCHTEHLGPHGELTNFSNFEHDTTNFPLTGKHQSTRCAACHVNQVYTGTAKSCVSCHAEPMIHSELFGTDCAKCHTTVTWRAANPSGFDHNLAAFKLTGKHATTNCTARHKNQVYRGTPQTCSACHSEPKVHLGRFGTACATCHSTTTWKNAKITAEFHRFPIYHGGGKNRGECITCHKTPNDYRSYTCYGCHRHDPDKTAEKHLKWKIDELHDCAKCHPTGRKRLDQPAKEKERKPERDDSSSLSPDTRSNLSLGVTANDRHIAGFDRSAADELKMILHGYAPAIHSDDCGDSGSIVRRILAGVISPRCAGDGCPPVDPRPIRTQAITTCPGTQLCD